MPTVSNLAVSVTAHTAEFNQKMQQSAGIVRSFGRTVVGVARSLLTFNNAMRALKLVGVTLATRYALKFADAIITTADKVGLATKELIGLRFAAGLAGIKMGDLTKFLEKAATKFETIGDVLKSMGVSREGLALMVEITEKLGVSMNQLQSDTVREAIAAMRRLWTVIKATSLIIARDLGPVIRWAAKGLLNFAVLARVASVELFTRLEPYLRSATDWLMQFGTMATNTGTVVPMSFGLIAEAGAKLANSLALMESAWHGLNAVVRSVTADMLLAFDKVLDGIRHVVGLLPGLFNLLDQVAPIPGFVKDRFLGVVMDMQGAVLDTHTKVVALSEALAESATKSFEKMTEAFENFKSGKYGEAFKAEFADMAERAAKIVTLLLKLQNLPLKIPDMPSRGGLGGVGARARTAEFQQIALSRVAIQGVNVPGRVQVITSPQLEITNEELRGIRTLMSLTRIAVTS